MRKIIHLIAILVGCVLIFSLAGCTPYYAFGNAGIEPIAFTKSLYADSIKVSTYIGGKFTHSIDSAYYHRGETNYFGQFYWAQTHIEKHFNYSYGAFGYIGSYKVLEVESYAGKKPYYGGGLSGEVNYNVPLKTIDLRFIGVKGTLLYENGEFTGFRRIASQQQLITGVTASRYSYNISMTQGFDFNVDKGRFGVDISSGITYFLNDKPEFLTSSINIHYTYKHCTAYIQNTNSFLGIGSEFAVGLNYRIK
ncbi:MAG: hypothetical protein PHT07_16185 [Paludibacter sp.]|nr:hypothetical protein [Paludibacter sp.]